MSFSRDGLKLNGFGILTDEEVERIHQSSIEILDDVGIEIDNKEILHILEDGGCDIDFDTQVAYLPPNVIEDALSKTRPKVNLCGRNSEMDIKLGTNEVYVRTTGGPSHVRDLYTGGRRDSRLEDIKLSCKLADYLDQIDGVSVFQMVPMDVPRALLDIYAVRASFLNTRKHLFYYTQNEDLIDYVLEMAMAIAGSEKKLRERPLLSGFCEITSPLKLVKSQAKLLLKFVKKGLPVYTHSHPIAGLSAPVTLAGEVALMNAETLAVVVISQLLRCGAPILYGTSASVPNMQKAFNLSGAVEVGLLGCALSEMANKYNLPSTMTSGTDAKIPDAQASMERILTSLPPVLSNLDLVNLSTTDTKLTYSFSQLVLDNELISHLARLMQGITVNTETLAVDLIKDVGREGSFLSNRHTVEHARKELMESELTHRGGWDSWKQQGSKSLGETAREEAKRILETYSPKPVEESIKKDLTEVFEKAESAVGG